MPLRAVFFDAGNTLFESQETIGESYRRFAAQYGLALGKNSLDARFQVAFAQAPPLAFPGTSEGELARLERQWWRQVVRRVFEGMDFPRFEAFFEALYTYFGEGEAWRLYPETQAVLENLQGKGCRLGIISNFDSRLHAICAALGIASYFDCMVFSSREGFAKPAPGIFRRALKHLALAPYEAVHVGDSLLHDVEGAKKAGLKAVWLQRSGPPRQGKEHRTIRTLSELSEHL